VIGQPPLGDYSQLRLKTVRKNTVFYRITKPGYPTPLYFNETKDGRYNAPDGSYGVCYMADSVECAFAESIGHSVAVRFQPARVKLLDVSELRAVNVFQVKATDTLRCVSLYSAGLPSLSLDNRINTSPPPYKTPQAWSKWIHESPNKPGGILYHSRHLPDGKCTAVFSRFERHLSWEDLGPLIDWSDRKMDIWDILYKHNWGVV